MYQKTLFLTLETFSQTGGIQKVCRTLAKALQDVTGRLTMYSLCDKSNDLLEKYISKNRFKGFRRLKIIFISKSILASTSHHTIVLAHINLLPVARIIKFIYPSRRIIMLAHGIEVWKLLNPMTRKFINKHVEIWAVSEYTKGRMTKLNEISPDKIRVLHNCLDPFFSIPRNEDKPVSLMSRYQVGVGDPVLLTVCRLSQYEYLKGYDYIIKSLPLLLKHHPKLKYIIIGPCNKQEKKRLSKLIEGLDLLAHVVIPGFVNEDELYDHFALADIFIMPSQKEGFGLALIEAAASGCKVIGGNKDGSTEALLGGRLGILVDPESPKQILNALQCALENTNRRSSKDIQKMALNSFSYSRYRNRVKSLIA